MGTSSKPAKGGPRPFTSPPYRTTITGRVLLKYARIRDEPAVEPCMCKPCRTGRQGPTGTYGAMNA